MLLQEHSSCLCSGENGKPFCLAELWPALIVRIHWDFTINAVHAFQNSKKKLFWFHTRASKVHFLSTEGQTFGQLWQLMTVSNVGAWTQAWQAMWAVFKIEGFVCKRFLPFFPTPSPLFYLRHFSRGLVPRSLLLNRTETLATQAIPLIKIFTEFTAIARISRWLELFFVSLQSSSKRGFTLILSEIWQ